MSGRGGYQAPSNPAPVSGPGALSQRTDVQSPMPMTGGPYGEATEMAEIQAGADMYAAPKPSMSAPVPLTAPTQMPETPLTAGIPSGPGPGPNAPAPAPNTLQAILAKMPQSEAEELLSYAIALGI